MKISRGLAAIMLCLLLAPPDLPPAAAQTDDGIQGSCTRTNRGYRCVYGPFTVSEGENNLNFKAAAIPREGYITGARVGLVDKAGNQISGHHIHIHHSDWLDPTVPPTICEYWPGAVIYMSGKERTRMRFPEGYGYHWRNVPPTDETGSAGDQTDPYWDFSAMLDRMHAGTDEQVYLRLNLSFKSMRADLTPVVTDFQRVTGCSGNPTFDVAKGSGADGKHVTTVRFEWPRDGRFVWATGHLHDGGLKLSLRNMTRDRQVMISRALYEDRSDPWYLTGTTTWSSEKGKAVGAGDVLRLRVTYDSTQAWDDVMGNLRITHTS